MQQWLGQLLPEVKGGWRGPGIQDQDVHAQRPYL